MKRVFLSLVFLLLTCRSGFAQGGFGVVAGQLRLRDGAPAGGLRVVATEAVTVKEGEKAEPLILGVTQTDNEGRYRLDGLPPGRYHILAGRLEAATYHPGVVSAGEATAVTIKAGDVADVSFPVRPRSLGLTISGRVVVDSGTPQPITVDLTGPENRGVKSNADGSFEFRDLSPGDYQLRANSPAALTQGFTLEDDSLTGIALAVRSEIPVTGSVAVQDEGPMPRFTLLLRSPQGSFSAAISPQANGGFRVALPSGEYRIMAVFPSGFRLDALNYDDQDVLTSPALIKTASAALTVRVGASSPVPWHKVSGRITDARGVTGKPAGVTSVTLSGGMMAQQTTATVGSDGTFEFPKVLQGSYLARVVPSPLGSTAASVTVAERDIDGVTIVVPAQIQVNGRVTVEGGGAPPRITLMLSTTGDSVQRVESSLVPGGIPPPPPPPPPLVSVNPTVRPDGTFTVTLPDGERSISVSNIPPASDVAAGDRPYAVKTMRLGQVDLLKEPLKLVAGEKRELVIALTPTGRMFNLSGRVTGNNAQFMASGKVLLNEERETSIRPDGTFRFEKIPPGSYSLRPLPMPLGATKLNAVVTDTDVTGLELFVPGALPVRGRVVLEDGAPLPRIEIQFTTPGGAAPVKRALVVAPDGSFQETLPEGERDFKVEVTAGSVTSAYVVRSVRYGTNDLLKNPLKLGLRDTQQLIITVGISRPLRMVSGRVAINNPEFRNGSVTLSMDQMPDMKSPVNKDGFFIFERVLSGTYTVRLLPELLGSSRLTVTVSDNNVSGIEMIVPELLPVAGTVIVEDNGPVPRMLRLALKSGSQRTPATLTVSPDGKFTTSWPAGERLLEFSPTTENPNPIPEGYALSSARYGETDLLTQPFKLEKGNARAMTITLRVTQPMFSVSGRVEGLANLQDVSSRGGRRVTLVPDRTSVGINRNVLESPITADGSFEFPKVLAGKYTVRLSPDVPGVSAAVTLTNSPVRELKLTIPKPAEPPKR